MSKRRQVQRRRKLLVLEASAEAESAASRLSHRGVRRGHFLGHVTSSFLSSTPTDDTGPNSSAIVSEAGDRELDSTFRY